MVKSAESSLSLQTTREKRWPYEEYYFGEEDSEGRKNGQGEQHWTGAESLEWYIGPMLHDTMHGSGDYRWRYKDPDGSFVSYEGRFFANQMHGYGEMSYPDGRVFTGLFHKDIRWGPGVERQINLKSNVGFWRGTQLARLVWRPIGPTVAPNLALGFQGPSFLDEFRTVLMKNIKIIGETNPAIELLKWYGANPVDATKKWQKLYPRYCTDVNSELFHNDLFEYKYYGKKINLLTEEGKEEQEKNQGRVGTDTGDDDDGGNKSDHKIDDDEALSYFSWNNNAMIIHMMKHCYKHEQQRPRFKISLEILLNGPRKKYRPASEHELNCRSLLLASYVGNITNVTQLVNEKDVYPDVADSQGNTALMYATCGDQTEVMHFLVEAGAVINSYNDSCCTPLGVALLRYLCVANYVSRSAMLNALLPVPLKVDKPSPADQKTKIAKSLEWKITRDVTQDIVMQKENKSQKSSSKVKIPKNQSFQSTQSGERRFSKDQSIPKDTTSSTVKSHKKEKGEENEANKLYDSDEDVIFSDEKKLFMFSNREYCAAICDEFAAPPKATKVTYLFTISNMVKDVDAVQEELLEKQNPKPDKKSPPKIKTEKSVITEKGFELEETDDKTKSEALSKIKLTILQLLTDGADPTLVRCPYSAILLAVKSGCPEMVKHMVSHGVDVNEQFPKFLNYTALDIIVAEPFSNDNFELIRALLEVGADARHRLKAENTPSGPDQPPWEEGPNLLHVVITKKSEFQFQEDIRRKTIEVLLKYNADPTAMYKGQSPLEYTMVKDINLLEPFILYPGTDLNAIINHNNHTILMKLFTKTYFRTILGVDKMPIITNLLLYGADPLKECYDENEHYQNLFHFAQKALEELAPPRPPEKKTAAAEAAKGAEGKGKAEKDDKNKSKTKLNKSKSKVNQSMSKLQRKSLDKDKPKEGKALEFAEYQDAINMVKECSRLLYVRWLQAKLLKELINVIHKFKQRHWTMILKENNYENAQRVGLWVNSTRCIEIWDILESSNNRKYKDENILRKLLRIVQFYQKRLNENMAITPMITAAEKNAIEPEVGVLMKEHRIARLKVEDESWKRPYVKPELAPETHKKFQVCFECMLPLDLNEDVEKLVCEFCGMVSFCDIKCLTTNVDRFTGHPCSQKLREKYCPIAEDDGNSPGIASLIE